MNLQNGKYMGIDMSPPAKGRKTPIYNLFELTSYACLGRIAWRGAWRSFCFYPEYDSVFDTGCMKQVVEWLEVINADYKEQKKAKRENV